MSERIRVCAIADIPDGGCRVVTSGPRRIAVFRTGDTFRAVKEACPHEGTPLSRGPVKDGVVTCPNHGYRFDLATGACVSHPSYRVSTYEVIVEEGEVFVKL